MIDAIKKILLLWLIISTHLITAQKIVINEDLVTVDFLFLDDDVEGTLSGFKFTGNLNFDALEVSNISGSVASETIDTDNWLRDRHLRNKYFKSEDFPFLKFESDSIIAQGDAYVVNGRLIIKEISMAVSIRFTTSSNLLVGTATINASDFDINIHDELARNELRLKITLPYTTN